MMNARVEPRLTIPASVKREANAPAYDAAGTGRRNAGWRPSAESINSILFGAAEVLRDKARDMARKNPWAQHGIQTFGAETIGSGIVPHPLHPDAKMRKALRDLWDRFAEQSDAHGVTDFYGQQRLAVQAVKTSGEVFGRLRPRRSGDGLFVPLQVQLIESDHVPFARHLVMPTGNKVRCGIEFDPIGRRAAYHMWRQHPGDIALSGSANELIRVPAAEVIHCFEPMEPSQIRGVTGLAAALMRLYEFDQMEDATLVRQRDGAMRSGFIIESPGQGGAGFGPGSGANSAGGDAVPDAPGNIENVVEVARLEPGTYQKLRTGEDVKNAEPIDMGEGFNDFMRWVLRAIAAAIGITYEQLTGDLTGVNYSSIRAGMLTVRRAMEHFQHSIVVHQLCRPTWNAFCDTAVWTGQLPVSARDYAATRMLFQAVKWMPPGWAQVDPLKEQLADKIAMRLGKRSRSMSVAADGYSAEQVDAEIAADNKRADRLGLIFDGDPRRTNASGGLQAGGQSGGLTERPTEDEVLRDEPSDPRDEDTDEKLALALIQQDEREANQAGAK